MELMKTILVHINSVLPEIDFNYWFQLWNTVLIITIEEELSTNSMRVTSLQKRTCSHSSQIRDFFYYIIFESSRFTGPYL